MIKKNNLCSYSFKLRNKVCFIEMVLFVHKINLNINKQKNILHAFYSTLYDT